MKRAMSALTAVALMSLVGVAVVSTEATAQKTAAPAAAGAFTVDAVHSTVLFKVKHLGVANAYGRFNDMSGAFVVDAASESGNSLEVSVNVESIDTANAGRDKHLRSPDFFSSKEFPTMTFKSTKFVKSGEKTFDVTGDLTFRGVTKTITVPVELLGVGKGRRGGEVAGIETTFTIKRSDYGMTYMVDNGGLGDEVTITVALEGGRA